MKLRFLCKHSLRPEKQCFVQFQQRRKGLPHQSSNSAEHCRNKQNSALRSFSTCRSVSCKHQIALSYIRYHTYAANRVRLLLVGQSKRTYEVDSAKLPGSGEEHIKINKDSHFDTDADEDAPNRVLSPPQPAPERGRQKTNRATTPKTKRSGAGM